MLPTLPTVRTPRAEIGHTAARLLLSLTRGDTELVQRESR